MVAPGRIFAEATALNPRHRQHLYVPSKLAYIRGKRPRVKCILCSVARGDKKVTPLVAHETPGFLVTVNLYPYNPGHLMVFPRRHVEDFRELGSAEGLELNRLLALSLDILQKHYSPHGFNLGCNMGAASGASIEHLHFHVVPRYSREKSFMDIISGTRIFAEDPKKALRALRKAFQKAPKG